MNDNPLGTPWHTVELDQSIKAILDANERMVRINTYLSAEMIVAAVNAIAAGFIIYQSDNGTGVYLFPPNVSPVEFVESLIEENDDNRYLVHAFLVYSYVNNDGKVILAADPIYPKEPE